MKFLNLFTALIANSVLIISCNGVSTSVQPTQTTQPPLVTIIAEPIETQAGPTLLNTPVEFPQMTITLVGMGLPAGFPLATPDPGFRFVAPQMTVFCKLPADSACEAIGPFELIDSYGTRHSPVIAVSGEGFLSKVAIPGSTSITGGMVFMVPSDTTSLLLRYIGEGGREAFFKIE